MNAGLCAQGSRRDWEVPAVGFRESFSGSLGLRGLDEMISKVSLPASVH